MDPLTLTATSSLTTRTPHPAPRTMRTPLIRYGHRPLATAALLLLATATATSAAECGLGSGADMKKLSFKVEVQANNQPPVQCTQKVPEDLYGETTYIVTIDCGAFKIMEKDETFSSVVARHKEGRAGGQGADKLPNYTLFDKAGERFFFPNSRSSTSSVITCSSDGNRRTSVEKTVLKSDAARVVITRTFIQVRAAKAQF